MSRPNRPVRALILKSNDFKVAGAVRLVEMYLAHLDRSRVEPILGHVVTPERERSLHAISPRCADMESHDVLWRGIRNVRAVARELRELIDRTGAEVVTSNDMRTDFLCRMAGGSRGMGIPWTAFVHGWTGFKRTLSDMRYGVYELMDRWSVRGADEVWTGSHACAADVRKHLPQRVPTKVLMNAAEPYYLQTRPGDRERTRAEYGVSEDELLVGTMGRMALAKGHALLAKAVVESGCDNVKAMLIGFGEEEENLKRMAEQPPYRDRIVLPGADRSVNDMPRHLAALDLFCFPSLQESLPVSVLEAMYMGCPIAASRTGDLPLVLEEGKTGLLFPIGDVDAMAECIRRYARDAEFRATMRQRAIERVRRDFLAPRFSKDCENAWIDIVERAGSRARMAS